MKPKAVFLDADTLGKGFSLAPLEELPLQWKFYGTTPLKEISPRILDATIVLTNKVALPKEVLQQADSLKLICETATGYDNIDVKTAQERGITVCNIPDYSSTSVIQLTMLLIQALFSNLIPYVELTRAGKWQKSPLFCLLDYPIRDMQGKTLGIVGHGNIGKGVAKLASAFGMNVLIAAHGDPSRSAPGSLPLQEVLKKVDVLSLHVPMTPSTRNLISAKELATMKSSAFLINVSRGGIVNEADLAEALKKGVIAGAALDVLSQEPPKDEQPLLQKEVPNLILTPHIGWASLESRKRLLGILKQNIEAFLKGAPQNKIV